jgi:hypothetical protein
MRIISKKHDYYDCIQRYGQDQSRVYVRKAEEIERFTITDNDLESLFEEMQFSLGGPFNSDDYQNKSYFIGFCGKVYPLLAIRYYDYNAKKNFDYKCPHQADIHPLSEFRKSFFAYSLNDILEFVSDRPELEEYIDSRSKRNFCFSRGFSYLKQNIFNDRFNREKFLNLFIKYNTPIFTSDYRSSSFRYDCVLLNSSNLHTFKFQKVFGPYDAYQELEMFISNVLKLNEPVTVDVNDKTRIKKHGFDKMSFRKPPSKKK